ncbi:hypothetical protein MYX75_02560 [Acidobacteria bacterium AH-259-A15]|nr:hypothetical protein [Acidobacteria bacterium AH-259-A15]
MRYAMRLARRYGMTLVPLAMRYQMRLAISYGMAILLLMSTPMSAQTATAVNAPEEVYTEWISQSVSLMLSVHPLDRLSRDSLARGILEVFSELDRAIPNLSPREHDWVESEMNAHRLKNLMETRELAIYEVKPAIRDMVTHLKSIRAILAMLEDKDGRPNKSERLKIEVFHWASALEPVFMDKFFLDRLERLEKAGIITEGAYHRAQLLHINSASGRHLMDVIIIPYLNDSLPDD